MAHRWSAPTHVIYQSKLRYLSNFASLVSGLNFFSTPALTRPPNTPDISLMWAEEAYGLRPGRFGATAAFGTIRTLRSAFSQFEAVRAVNSGIPARLDHNQRLVFQPSRTTDQARHSFFTTGLAARIGTQSKPSVALLARHVQAIDALFLSRYSQAVTPSQRRLWSLAGLANALLWLAWLRSSELFTLHWSDIDLILPALGPTRDLPRNVGAVILSLGPTTKTQRTTTPSVAVAYQCLSGLCCGRWLRRAMSASQVVDLSTDYRNIFTHDDGSAWSSSYFRFEHLYPALAHLRDHGDAFLQAFDDTPGNSLEDKFWSLHCYRRGARTHATKRTKRERRATLDQVYEHGRWRRQRKNEPIDKQYDEWTLQDRLFITLFCF